MTTITKIMNKDLNLSLLQEELRAVGLGEQGLVTAGFDRWKKQELHPFTERRAFAWATGQPDNFADPGELRFRYDPPLDAAQEAILDGVLAAHDATVRSREQTSRIQDTADALTLADNVRNWRRLTRAQKDENDRIVTRLAARLQDRGLDL